MRDGTRWSDSRVEFMGVVTRWWAQMKVHKLLFIFHSAFHPEKGERKMALVMLPCELPWWSVVVRKIASIETTNEVDKILETMQKIHDLCK